MGYWRAGFDVVGVDLAPQPNYPFDYHQADALEFPLEGFDAYHASPPCQLFSQMSGCRPGVAERHPGLIAPTRARLEATGKPYVIENVVNAPLRPDLFLCGTMFGYRLYRHRLFESNVPMDEPEHPPHQGAAVSVYGHMQSEPAREVMAISWTTRAELAQAVPPYFTQYIGGFLLRAVRGEIQLATRSFQADMADMAAPALVPGITSDLMAPTEPPELLPTTRARSFRWEDMRPAERPGVPPAAMASSEAAVFFTVLHQTRPTVRSLAAALGLSTSHVHQRLCELRVKGLVIWEEGRAGTIRPNVGLVVTKELQQHLLHQNHHHRQKQPHRRDHEGNSLRVS
jgi:DNA (cytosine-5)-methyltransferase 1